MLELEHGFRILDSHLKLEPDDRRRPRDIGDPEELERELHQAGIVNALAFSGSREGSYLKANNAVARVAVERPFVAAARINGCRDPSKGFTSALRNVTQRRSEEHTSPADIEQYAYEDRFVAFMTNPAVDGLPDTDVLETLESVERPLLTYGGRGFPPAVIEDTLLTYEFPVIIAHCGGYPLDAELMSETIDMLDRHENVFVDTSFVRLRNPLERAIIEHPDRVLFGSGTPQAHPNVAVMEILTLDVPEDAMRRVFSKNVSRVIEEF